MKRIFFSLFALVLVVAMLLPMASCGKDPVDPVETDPAGTDPVESDPVEEIVVEKFEGDFTYEDAVTTLSANWNTHTYQTSDESYPVSFLTTGLYGFFFNDNAIYTSEKDAYAGYVIAPEMAAEMPIDVTEAVKAAHPEFNIPADATSGYAYEIKLNPNATWENGEAITADTYVYSMKELLNPLLMNYRGPDYFDGSFCIANADNYYYQIAGFAGKKLEITVDKWLAKADTNKEKDLFVNMDFWGCTGALDAEGNAAPQWISVTDETLYRDLAVAEGEDEDWISAKYLYETYLKPGAPYASYSSEYVGTGKVYAPDYAWENVGIFKNDEYSITIVLGKALAGFNLLYNLSGNWIVYEPYYEASKAQVGDTDAWTTDYCSKVENTMSYGPYKLTAYQMDKEMTFERNENWFGYTDGKHIYKDPEDGLYYPMYQTTKIHCQVVSEPQTRKQMFLAGQLIGYGLQSEDFTEYRDSDYAHVTPSETIFFFIFNGYEEAIKNREANEGFDQTKFDLETMLVTDFRKAIAVTYDKEALCATISPSRTGGYGLIGNSYIYDPENALYYRDTPQAKQALCDFYSVDVSKFGGDLDAAVDSITGYDPETAKVLFTSAFEQALEAGYVTDADNDGKCDQMVRIEYASSAPSSFITKTLEYLNDKLAEVLVGTPYEGKVEFYESAPLGNAWSDNIRNGLSDTVLGGWSGSALDPFGLTDLYANPEKQFDAKWFNSSSVTFTLEVNTAKPGETPAMETLTLTLKQWSDALNGTTVEANGKSYNFGDGMADVDTRLSILAKFEATVLATYDYIPMLQDGSIALLSQKVFYVVDEYNPIMGRGGIAYMKYNYNDTEWTDYVASQDGVLKY